LMEINPREIQMDFLGTNFLKIFLKILKTIFFFLKKPWCWLLLLSLI